MVSTVLNLESARWSDLSKAHLKGEESPSCAASTVAPTLSRQNSAESAFSAAPRQLLCPAHQEYHSKPDDDKLHLSACEDVHSVAFPSQASMVQSRFAIRMGVDNLCGEVAGVDEQSMRPCGDVPAVVSDVKQSSRPSMVQNRFAIQMGVDELSGNVPGESEQRSFCEVHAVPAASKHSSTPSLAQKRFAIRMREEGVLSDTTESSVRSTQVASTQQRVQTPDASKKSMQEAVATSHIEAEQIEQSGKPSLAQKRWAIRMGDETSFTSQALSAAASSQQSGQLQEVESIREPTWAEKRFAIRMGRDDREAGCFALATECQRSMESSIVPPVCSGSALRAPRASFAETRFAVRMPDFDDIGVF